MKTLLFFFVVSILCVNNALASEFVVNNFDTTPIGQTFSMRAWNAGDGTATVAADPANANNRVVRIQTINWDAMVRLSVTLPAGQTLANYQGFSFDIYIPTHPNDANPNHKNMFIFLDNVQKYSETTFPLQAPIATWTTKSFQLSALGLTAAELAKNSFVIEFGISANNANYFIDNVRFTGGPAGGGGGTGTGTGIVEINNFDTTPIGQTFSMRAWNAGDGTATVAADPANANNRVVRIQTTNWDAMLRLSVTLPSGHTLANYQTFSFDIYIPTHPNDANPNHKNMFIFLDNVQKYSETTFPLQAPIATWTTKTFQLSALGLTAAELAKNSFVIDFGISANNANYFIDNVRLSGGPTGGGGPVSRDVNMDFNATPIGQTFGMRAWNAGDGTATVAADPTNANNRSVQIVTTNWDAMLRLPVTLPAGQTLANYQTFSFDIYIPTHPNDANPNHKNMFIYLDNVQKYTETTFPLQAPIATWTTKTFQLSALGLTAAELAKNSFVIDFGISANNANYFIDNVRFISSVSTSLSSLNEEKKVVMSIHDNQLFIHADKVNTIYIFDTKGSKRIVGNNKSVIDVSQLTPGVYVVRAHVNGKWHVNKILR